MGKKIAGGLSSTRIYSVYRNMIARCTKPTNKDYYLYGARGIGVCQEWLDSFLNFYNWGIHNGYDENLSASENSLDRIDPDKDYEPDNCRWVPMMDQVYNRRITIKLAYAGETHTIMEWSQITGIDQTIIRARRKLGWPIEKILSTPVAKQKQHEAVNMTYNGATHSIKEWADITGIGAGTISSRYYELHWPVEKILTTPVRPLHKHSETNQQEQS